MKFGLVFVIFLIVLLTRDAEGKFSFDSIKDLVFPRNPQVNRVRRVKDANGDRFAVLDTVGLVEQHGYPAEEHKLTTVDGYNLIFFRIPGSPKSPPAKGKPIVFLQHGMILSSDTWVLVGPNHDLSFQLADAGYDVWIGNIRGNTYCRSHTNLSTTDKNFWDFSWHETATIDVPSTIDYALEHSGQKTLFYVGYSMGTTMSYVLLSEKPEYNEKMRLVVSLAPVGNWKYKSNFVYELLLQYAPKIKEMTDAMGIYDLIPQTKFYAITAEASCNNRSSTKFLCQSIMQTTVLLILGKPAKELNYTTLPYLIKYLFAGVSVKTMMHYQQTFTAGVLKKFDYGPIKNLKIYVTEEPPLYDLSKISAPYALFYGKTDELASATNAIELSKLLRNVVTCEAVPSPDFNHIDFIIAENVKDLLYRRILELYSKF